MLLFQPYNGTALMCDNGTKKDNLKTLNQNVSNSRLWLVWSNIRPKANYNYWLYQCVVITPSKKKKKKNGSENVASFSDLTFSQGLSVVCQRVYR